jgi:endonuclease-3 related protein
MTPGKVGKLLQELYDKLWQAFGPQGWWPGETPFEVVLGAILTQNTNWNNVAKVMARLKAEGRLTAQA